MSCFIYFYIMVPIIAKWVKNLQRAIEFYIMCFGIFVIWKIGINLIFSSVEGIDRLNNCIGASPFGMLYNFAVGIIAYWAIKEHKQNIAGCVFLLIAVSGLMVDRNAWTWAALSAMAIMLFEAVDLKSKSDMWNRFILKVSNLSMYIYLAHLMSFDICWNILNRIDNLSLFRRYFIWTVTSILCIILIVLIMSAVDKTVKKIMLSKKNM